MSAGPPETSVTPGIQDDDGSFQRETIDEIETRFKERAQQELGSDVDLSQGSPIKQLIDVVVLETDHMWQLLEDVYYSAYYGHAYEEQLDKLLELSQFERIPRRGATGEVRFSVNTANPEDVIIPEGTRVSTVETDERPAIPYKTTEPATLPAGQNHVSNVGIRAAEPWEADLNAEWLGTETNVASNTITVFQTPITGVDSVTNPHPTGAQSHEAGYSFIDGRDRESDAEFRTRFEEQMGQSGTATVDAIRAEVLALSGVRSADVEENVDMVDNTDTGGLPPKSFRVTVLGQEPDDGVAQAISDVKAAGIESYGTESGVAILENGDESEESFDRSDETQIYIDVTVQHDENFPTNGSLDVENGILEYIGGERADGEVVTGVGMGDDVVYDLVFKEAMNVAGVVRVDLEIGKDPAEMGTSDLEIMEKATAMTEYTDINVFTEQLDP